MTKITNFPIKFSLFDNKAPNDYLQRANVEGVWVCVSVRRALGAANQRFNTSNGWSKHTHRQSPKADTHTHGVCVRYSCVVVAECIYLGTSRGLYRKSIAHLAIVGGCTKDN